jgi:hypothetical protein
MRTILLRIVTLLIVAPLFGCAGPQATPADRITVTDTGEKYEISVAKSKVTLLLPKGDLRQNNDPRSGAAASPRYFFLTGASSGVNISGWFEPAERRGDVRASWKAEMEGLQKAGFSQPTDVSESGTEDRKVILYNLPLPSGSSSHARCSYVQSGTWVDLHLSVSGKLPTDQSRARLLSFLNAISIEDRR